MLLQTIEHAIAAAASDVVKTAKFIEVHVLPALKNVQANEAIIETVTGLVSPQAENIERVAFGILGVVIKAIQDADAATQANGVNISLDAALIADIKSIVPAIQAGVKKVAVA